MQTDLEEAKAQEIAKLQDALHEMQSQVEEAKSMVIKEREAARKAIEESPPVVKETPVIVQDTEKINSLTSEVEKLKVCIHFCLRWYIIFPQVECGCLILLSLKDYFNFLFHTLKKKIGYASIQGWYIKKHLRESYIHMLHNIFYSYGVCRVCTAQML